MVSRFQDWSIRNKLILPLLAVMVLGGAGIIWALMGMYDEIMNDALPEERALNGIRYTSLELLGEYREFTIVLSDYTQREIDELKEKIDVYKAVFDEVAGVEEHEAGFVEAIEAAEQEMKRIGDETIAARLRLLNHIEAMDKFETAISHVTGGAQDVAVPVQDRQIPELAKEYISKLRVYVLGHNYTTRREIEEIEQYLEDILRAHDDPASEPGDQAQDANNFESVRQLIEAGRATVALTNIFLTKLEALEVAEDSLVTVLDEAGSFVAHETDEAFEAGFANVAGLILAVLMLIILVGYLVSRGITTPISLLANAADRIGGGDLNARADVRTKDEIGGLATAFNQMATNLESNIEQRERAERAEQRFKDFAEAASDWFWEMDAYLRFSYVSERFFETFHLRPEAVIGKTRLELADEAQVAADPEKWRRHFDDLEAQRPVRDFVYGIVGDDGEQRYLSLSCVPVFDEAGNFKGYRGIDSDVTERKRTEEMLRSADERFASLATSIPGVVYQRRVSPDGDIRYTYISEGAKNLFGVSPEEILADPQALFDCHGPEYRATFRERLLKASRELTMWDVEAQIITRDGAEKWTHAIARPHREPDGSVLWNGVILDATRIKKAALELRKAKDLAELSSRAKSEFLAAMSHELRTPLNAIIGFSEIIKNETLGPVGSLKYREYSSDINESGQHLLGLINDILDLSKIESGTDKLHEEKIEIPEIIHSALKLVGQRAEHGGIKLELELADQLPALRADERKLKQILVNLLSNAIKFTEKGGAVTLRAWCRKDSGYVFQIVDTGIGIAPEDIPKALSRFGQVDGDLNREYEGTGLGLPLTKALVELHGGSLDLQSEVSVGTTVTVRFPAEPIVASLDNSDSLGVEHRAAG